MSKNEPAPAPQGEALPENVARPAPAVGHGPLRPVGYKSPPKEHQFKPGQSGNPKGKEKDTKNLATDLREEAAERVAIREGEQTQKVSKQRAMIKRLFADALRGNTRATTLLFALMQRTQQSGGEAPLDNPLDADEQLAIDQFLERAMRKQKGHDDEPSSK